MAEDPRREMGVAGSVAPGRDRVTPGLVAVLAGALICATLLVLALLRGGGGYTVRAEFENASQVVGGEIVTLAGEQVGTVEDIELAADGTAVITFGVDEPYAPLRRGTTATVRSFSLAGVANRQLELKPPVSPTGSGVIEDGGTMPSADTVAEVDLDAVLNTLDEPTVSDLKRVIGGLERSYDGIGEEATEGLRYLNPLLSTSRRLVSELARDDAELERAVVETDRLAGALAGRANEISALIGDANATFAALAADRGALADGIGALPGFMRNFNATAVNLRTTLDDLDPLVEASRPAVRELRPFFAELRGAAAGLVPTVDRLDRTIRKPGRQNDLIELTRSLPPLADIAVGPVRRNGDEREGALPESTLALTDSLPILSFFRPYTPELLSWMDDFGHSGITDANGGLGRIAAAENTFAAAIPGFPQIFSVPETPTQQIGALSINNRRRCPGSQERDPGDGSIPFTDGGAIDCEPSQSAVGP